MKKLCLAAALLLLLSGCAPAAETQKKELFAMDTIMTLSATGQKADAALSAAVAAINHADTLWNYEQESSELYKLNHAGTTAIQCSAETIDVLVKALKYARLTKGRFDPTIAPLSAAWDITGNPRVPSDAELAKLLPLVDYTQLVIEGDTARFAKEGMMADLGGIGKGAISDTVMQIMKDNGVNSALISLGGNIGAMGKKSGGAPYKIGIRDPDGTQNDTVGYITMTDVFVISSADNERFFIQDGVRYHHIFDPSTGKPANNGLRQVTIVSENGAMGDAYSTALFVMGLTEALSFQKAQGDFQAIWITSDKKITVTEGLRPYFTFTAADKGYTYEEG
jgi:thiamine biosynthesis lipoprotein